MQALKQFELYERLPIHSPTHSLTHSLLTQSLTLSLSLLHTLAHTLTHTLSHIFTHSHSHTLVQALKQFELYERLPDELVGSAKRFREWYEQTSRPQTLNHDPEPEGFRVEMMHCSGI